MTEIRHATLGRTWLAVLRETYGRGETRDGETRELLGVSVAYERGDAQDPLLLRFGSAEHIAEMRKVFFSAGSNGFGHSYRDQLRGPLGRSDLSDVVELLAREPCSKRAVATFVGDGDGRVPCINAVHFLRRDGALRLAYFSRGQDIFRKFYADGVCLYEMGRRVAAGLDIPLALVSGTISSAHVYLADLPEIEAVLAEAESLDAGAAGLPQGVL